MRTLIPAGRLLFAIALVAFGIQHIIFQDFITGRAPGWTGDGGWGHAWAYVSGGVFILAGFMILSGRRGRYAALVAAAMIVAWAILRHIPIVASEPLFSPAWTSAGKALFLSAGALAIAATLPKEKAHPFATLFGIVNLRSVFITVSLICLGLFFIVTGVQHFIYTEFVASLIPDLIPGPVYWTYFTGVALAAGGLGMIIPRTAPLAALLSGLMVFIWVFVIHMPRAFGGLGSGGEWIALFEAIAVSGIAFVMAGYLYQRERDL
jgi:uncharacterized membrane protein